MSWWNATKLILTLWAHADRQTLLQAAVLTAIAVQLGDWAVTRSSTGIAQLFADAALEKSFATLTADGSIVSTCPSARHIYVTLACAQPSENKTLKPSVHWILPRQSSEPVWLSSRHSASKQMDPKKLLHPTFLFSSCGLQARYCPRHPPPPIPTPFWT